MSCFRPSTSSTVFLEDLSTKKLKLKVNESKSEVGRPWQRKFLGFSFTRGKQPKRRVAPQSVARFKKRIRELNPASKGRHLTGISRAVLRLDGFVSANADYRGGQITTPPIRFAGRRLELNVDTSGGGSVHVEVLNEAQQLLPGFAEADALPVNGNSVRMPVRWETGGDVSSLSGRPVRLRFRMQDCKLYAFQFRE